MSSRPAAVDVRGQVVPSGPGFAEENNLRLFTTLIYSAQRRISIVSPYFVPDESLLYAVTTAAQRGVRGRALRSAEGDQFMVWHAQRSYYEVLLRAGVRIWLYPAPYVLHAKFFSIDDDVAVIGSSNMDMRSFGLNYEVSLMLLGAESVATMREVQDTYRAMCAEPTLDEWELPRRKETYVDNVMRGDGSAGSDHRQEHPTRPAARAPAPRRWRWSGCSWPDFCVPVGTDSTPVEVVVQTAAS